MSVDQVIPITGKTKIIAILADPIAQVQTPRIMNMLLQKAQYDAVCVPFQVAAEDLEQCLAGLKLIPSIVGAVVTVPHKMNMCVLTEIKGTQAQVIGAVNAIRFDEQRLIHGEMFDGKGFVQGLKHADLQINSDVNVFIAGAGGVARGIAFALLECGVKNLAIHNRTKTTAEALVGELQDFAPDANVRCVDRHPQQMDLCINATSAGMLGPLEHHMAFDLDGLDHSTCIAEVVMSPAKTQLLLQAEAKGMKMVSGQAMLMAQIGQLAAFILNAPELTQVDI